MGKERLAAVQDGGRGGGWPGPPGYLLGALTALISSEINMSTHLRHASRIFFTCFFTMVPKAMSGVKSPVLNGPEREKGSVTGQPLPRVPGEGPAPLP